MIHLFASFPVILRWFSLVSSDVQSLFCFPRSSHFRSFDSNCRAFEISCLTASTYQRILDYRFWPHIHPVIDCRVLFENILDSLDYVIDLPVFCHFTSSNPVERSVLLAPDFISSNIFRRTSFALSLIQVLYLVTSRYIPSVSYVGSRYYVLARFIRRHFMVLGFYHFIPSGYYDVLLVFKAFI